MTRCTHEADLMAEGRVVGRLRCELEAGHHLPDPGDRFFSGEPHVATLHWEDGEVIAEDDDEPGVEVPVEEPTVGGFPCSVDGKPCPCGFDSPDCR